MKKDRNHYSSLKQQSSISIEENSSISKDENQSAYHKNIHQIYVIQQEPQRDSEAFILQFEIKQIILKHQNTNFNGFYDVNNWKNLNRQLNEQKKSNNQQALIQLWNIFKAVNVGQKLIPTGIIYDTLFHILSVNRTLNQKYKSILQLFNNFLKMNKIDFKYQNIKQTKNYWPLKKIIDVLYKSNKNWKKTKTQNLQQKQQKTAPALKKKQFKLTKFQQLYHKGCQQNIRKHQMYIQNQQRQTFQELQQCTFHPLINRKKKKNIQIKKHKICKQQQKQQNKTIDKQFKAMDLPKYPDIKIQNIPGAALHIQRYQKRIKQDLKIKQYFENRSIWSITQRKTWTGKTIPISPKISKNYKAKQNKVITLLQFQNKKGTYKICKDQSLMKRAQTLAKIFGINKNQISSLQQRISKVVQ